MRNEKCTASPHQDFDRRGRAMMMISGPTEKQRMAHKQILFHSAAREKVLRGATLLADAVRVTLGPKSKSVLI